LAFLTYLISFNQTNGIFELEITNAAKEKAIWTIDMKNEGKVYKGNAKPKADVTIIMSDDLFKDLADEKVRLPPIPSTSQ
jgi:hypothetical protein